MPMKLGFLPNGCKIEACLMPKGVWHAICEGIQRFNGTTNPGKGASRARRRNSVTADNNWT
jgi:hypothetical protein